MKKYIYISFLIFVAVLSSCKSDDQTLVTGKIQYDVNIVSPDPSYDWWIQNIVGPDREKLVDIIVEGAKSGKWQAYDYFNEPISAAEVRGIFADTMMVTLVNEEPPYDYYDSTVIYNILNKDIMKIRFLEEWKLDKETLQFSKKIYGIGPVAKRYDFNGIERWQPLFWIYTDKDFIDKLEN